MSVSQIFKKIQNLRKYCLFEQFFSVTQPQFEINVLRTDFCVQRRILSQFYHFNTSSTNYLASSHLCKLISRWNFHGSEIFTTFYPRDNRISPRNLVKRTLPLRGEFLYQYVGPLIARAATILSHAWRTTLEAPLGRCFGRDNGIPRSFSIPEAHSRNYFPRSSSPRIEQRLVAARKRRSIRKRRIKNEEMIGYGVAEIPKRLSVGKFAAVHRIRKWSRLIRRTIF